MPMTKVVSSSMRRTKGRQTRRTLIIPLREDQKWQTIAARNGLGVEDFIIETVSVHAQRLHLPRGSILSIPPHEGGRLRRGRVPSTIQQGKAAAFERASGQLAPGERPRLAVDGEVLARFFLTEAPRHRATRSLVSRALQGEGWTMGLSSQVLRDFVLEVTDEAAYERPMTKWQAASAASRLWDAREIIRIQPEPWVLHDALDLITRCRIGADRLPQAAYAAALRAADIRFLLTLDPVFGSFSFLTSIEP